MQGGEVWIVSIPLARVIWSCHSWSSGRGGWRQTWAGATSSQPPSRSLSSTSGLSVNIWPGVHSAPAAGGQDEHQGGAGKNWKKPESIVNTVRVQFYQFITRPSLSNIKPVLKQRIVKWWHWAPIGEGLGEPHPVQAVFRGPTVLEEGGCCLTDWKELKKREDLSVLR